MAENGITVKDAPRETIIMMRVGTIVLTAKRKEMIGYHLETIIIYMTTIIEKNVLHLIDF